MGVDARILVRLKGESNWLAEPDLLAASYQIASTVGPTNFMITSAMGDDWPFERHHAISILKRIVNENEARDDYGLGSEFVGKLVWTQDGPPIIGEPGEQFLQVHIAQRLYHEEYARGYWPTIRSVIEWLMLRFPAGEFWYGGDSSGFCAERVTPERLTALNNYYLATGNRTYQRYFATPVDRVTGQGAPTCPTCKVMAINCGGGQGQTFWYCDGCGRNVITSKDGARWLKPGEEFFSASSKGAAS